MQGVSIFSGFPQISSNASASADFIQDVPAESIRAEMKNFIKKDVGSIESKLFDDVLTNEISNRDKDSSSRNKESYASSGIAPFFDDACERAQTLHLDEIYQIATYSSSRLVSLPEKNVHDFDTCTSGFEPDQLGLCFFVQGITTGRILEASTTSSNESFNSQILVFSGTSCDQIMNCVASNSMTVKWDSISNMDFYVLVYGWSNEVRDFEISVREAGIQSNSFCNGATVLESNDEIYSFNNFFLTEDSSNSEISYCDIHEDERGLWFKVIGSGDAMEVSTCFNLTDFDTKLSLLGGDSCDELECLSTNDDSYECGYSSKLRWHSILNVDYYILVSGSSVHDQGHFGISVKQRDHDLEVPVGDFQRENKESYNSDFHSHDICEGAKILDLELTSNKIHASNTYLAKENFLEDEYCEVYPGEIGVWFQVTGTGNAIEASTCNSLTDFDFDTKLSIFHGRSCDDLFCVISNDDFPGCGAQSAVIWDSILDVTYYILVHGHSDDQGNFGITVREIELQSNDSCDGAKVMDINENKIYITNNYYATPESRLKEVYCDIAHDEIGVWWQVVGTGNAIKASTCVEPTKIDTKISVFHGTSCNELICVVSNDNSLGCDDKSTVIWKSVLDVNYYILVRGADMEELGEFGLTVRDMPMLNADYYPLDQDNYVKKLGDSHNAARQTQF